MGRKFINGCAVATEVTVLQILPCSRVQPKGPSCTLIYKFVRELITTHSDGLKVEACHSVYFVFDPLYNFV